MDPETWKKGWPLSRAPEAFGNRGVRDEIEEIRKSNPRMRMVDAFREPVDFSTGINKAFLDAQRDSSRESDLLHNLKTEVHGKLIREHLVAYGYATPRQPADLPQRIPADVLAKPIYWNKDLVKADGLEFVGVKVFLPKWLPQPETAANSTSKPPEQSVAQLRRDALETTARKLIDENRLDPAAADKINADRIRQRVLRDFPEHFPGGKFLSDDTIRRVLQPALKRKPG